MIASILAKIGVPLLSGLLADSLKTIDSPVTKTAAKALDQVERELQTGRITGDQIAEANRHTEAMAELKLREHAKAMEEINASLRAEVASQDLYVRRMRPTFGYLMALTWAAQMLGVAYVLVFQTAQAGTILNAMSSLSAIWAVGLSVLGVYIYKRSEDKKIIQSQ